jgi:hypothetical protein
LAAYTEITIEQGATFTTTVNVEDAYYNPVNLTGYKSSAMLCISYYSSGFFELDTSITGTANGQITVAMSSANTSNLTPGRYVYDLIISDSSNTLTRVVEGIATVLPSVTR